MNVLRGQIYEAMDNRTIAMECFREALRQDVYCYEAFDLLVNHQMLSAQEGMFVASSELAVDYLFPLHYIL